MFIVAHSLLGALFLSLGEFAAAREHLERGIALYDPREHRFMASLYGDDPGVTCHCLAALNLWFLGYPDQALASAQKALAVAHDTGSPYCETFALDFVTWIHVLRREERAAQASIAALTTIAAEQGFQFLLADNRVLHGWTLAAQGSGDEGLEEVRSGIAAYEATGAVMSRPAHLTLLAKAYGKAGRTDEGLAAVGAALAVAEQTGERTYEAELYRLQGELTLDLDASKRTGRRRQVAAGAAAQAAACFQKAVDVASRQQAKSLELRARISFSRLRQEQGKRQQAREMLGEIYSWFTEGLDTADLREVQTLLADLA